MSLKKPGVRGSAPASETVSVVDPRERKNIAKNALKHLHASKAFKAKEKIKERPLLPEFLNTVCQ
jgi:hypothetical protein